MTEDAGFPFEQWWSALPTFFPWMQMPNATPAPDTGPVDSAPGLFSFDQLLTSLFDAWQPLLRSGGLATDGLWSMASQMEATFSKWRESLAMSSPPSSLGWPMSAMPGSWAAWGAPLLLAAGGGGGTANNPLQMGADRVFGAFVDGIGLRPLRDMQEAWLGLYEAEAERRGAQAAYVALVAKAWTEGMQRLVAKLEQMRRDGQQVTSFIAFVRLWARETDATIHAAMQSEEGLAASARAVRASTLQRTQLQRLVGLASTALNVPTRAEVDDAYREIQELKRELRRLKKKVDAQADRDDGRHGTADAQGAARPVSNA